MAQFILASACTGKRDVVRLKESAAYAACASRPFGGVSVAAHIVFIGGVPRLAEDVGCSCRFPPRHCAKAH